MVGLTPPYASGPRSRRRDLERHRGTATLLPPFCRRSRRCRLHRGHVRLPRDRRIRSGGPPRIFRVGPRLGSSGFSGSHRLGGRRTRVGEDPPGGAQLRRPGCGNVRPAGGCRRDGHHVGPERPLAVPGRRAEVRGLAPHARHPAVVVESGSLPPTEVNSCDATPPAAGSWRRRILRPRVR
jgi:hypothetical protein